MPADRACRQNVGRQQSGAPDERLALRFRARFRRDNNPHYGKTHGDETRAQMRARRLLERPGSTQSRARSANGWRAPKPKADGRRHKSQRCCPICRETSRAKNKFSAPTRAIVNSQGRDDRRQTRGLISGTPLSAASRRFDALESRERFGAKTRSRLRRATQKRPARRAFDAIVTSNPRSRGASNAKSPPNWELCACRLPRNCPTCSTTKPPSAKARLCGITKSSRSNFAATKTFTMAPLTPITTSPS